MKSYGVYGQIIEIVKWNSFIILINSIPMTSVFDLVSKLIRQLFNSVSLRNLLFSITSNWHLNWNFLNLLRAGLANSNKSKLKLFHYFIEPSLSSIEMADFNLRKYLNAPSRVNVFHWQEIERLYQINCSLRPSNQFFSSESTLHIYIIRLCIAY